MFTDSALIRAMSAFTEQDHVGQLAATGRPVTKPRAARDKATGRRRRAAGQLEGGEGSVDRPDALQEPPAVDAEPPPRLVDGASDQLVDRPVAQVRRRRGRTHHWRSARLGAEENRPADHGGGGQNVRSQSCYERYDRATGAAGRQVQSDLRVDAGARPTRSTVRSARTAARGTCRTCARGRNDGRKREFRADVRKTQKLYGKRNLSVADVARTMGFSRQTLYRYLDTRAQPAWPQHIRSMCKSQHHGGWVARSEQSTNRAPDLAIAFQFSGKKFVIDAWDKDIGIVDLTAWRVACARAW